jgi:hypothetical protein
MPQNADLFRLKILFRGYRGVIGETKQKNKRE